MLPRFLNLAEHRGAWLAGAFGTAVMLGFFALTLDLDTLARAWHGIPARTFWLVALLLGINGLIDGTWLAVITRGSGRPGDAWRVVAWHMLVQTLLPARLGDVAWMYWVHNWLEQPLARAIFMGFYHRLQDLMVVSALLVLSLAMTRGSFGSAPVIALAIVLLALATLACLHLERLLGWAGRVLLWLRRRFRRRWLTLLLEHLLMTRAWYRHRLARDQVVLSFVAILLRWVTIVAAVALVIRTLAPVVASDDSFFLANAYIYLGVVPVQSVGGFGTGEAGLAWLLTYYGVPLAQASALGLLTRVLINLVHLALWLVVIPAVYLLRRFTLRTRG